MTDTPPNPKRRRWRWLVIGLLLFVVGFVGLREWRLRRLMRRAAQIEVGMSQADVFRTLGMPPVLIKASAAGRLVDLYGFQSQIEMRARGWLANRGWNAFPAESTFPVEVEYDSDKRVQRIRTYDRDISTSVE